MSDAVDGFIKAMGRTGFEIFNTGGGNPVTLKQLIAMIETKLGKKAQVQYSAMQLGEVDHTCADTTKSYIELNYKAQISIDEGLEKYINWFKEENYV